MLNISNDTVSLVAATGSRQHLTPAQRRLIQCIRDAQGIAEDRPVVNDWVKDRGPAASLALTNINRTVDVLIRQGYITIDADSGEFQLTERGERVR